jgi:hypothetical protein
MANLKRIFGVLTKPRISRPSRDISKTPKLRKAKPAELEKMGASPKSERYVL